MQPGVVLHRRAYRESSLLVEVFTAEAGRVGLVARGQRRGRGKATLEPLAEYALSWTGRGELKTLTGADPMRRAALVGEPAICALYVNELLLRLLAREDPAPQLYAAYWATLDALAHDDRREPALRGFERRLLSALGYGFDLRVDADGAPIRPAARYRLDTQAGLIADNKTGAVRGTSALAFAAGDLPSPEARADIKRLMRQALAPHLGPRPLEAPRLLRALRNLVPAADVGSIAAVSPQDSSPP